MSVSLQMRWTLLSWCIAWAQLWHSPPSWLCYWLSRCTRWRRQTATQVQALNTVYIWQLVLTEFGFWIKHFSVSQPESQARCSASSTENTEVIKSCWLTHFIAQKMILWIYIFSLLVRNYIVIHFLYILLPGPQRCRWPPLCCFTCQSAQQIKTTEDQHQEWKCVLQCEAVELDRLQERWQISICLHMHSTIM